MKNTATNPFNFSAAEMRHSIILTDAQFKLYKTSQMHVYSPAGEYLCTVGQHHHNQKSEIEMEREANQLALLECLIVTSNGELQLSDRAVIGLAETLSRAQGLILR